VTNEHNFNCRTARSACHQKCSLAGIFILGLLICNGVTLKCSASSHKVHSGAQRYDDVIIIRHADGTIESRDARAPTVTYDDGSSSSRPAHHAARASHGGKSGTKVSSSAKSNRIAHASSSNKAVRKHQHSSHTSAYGGDDVEIIRNADGSVEARDAH